MCYITIRRMGAGRRQPRRQGRERRHGRVQVLQTTEARTFLDQAQQTQGQRQRQSSRHSGSGQSDNCCFSFCRYHGTAGRGHTVTPFPKHGTADTEVPWRRGVCRFCFPPRENVPHFLLPLPRGRARHVRPRGFSTRAKAPQALPCLTRVPRSKKAEGQARKAATKEANSAKEDAAQAAIEDADWEVGGKKGNKKQEADAAKKSAKADRKADADAQVSRRACCGDSAMAGVWAAMRQ